MLHRSALFTAGVFNLVGPEPVRNKRFCEVLAAVLGKPCWLPMPGVVLRVMLGEIAEELLLAGQRVYPRRLLEAGFAFGQGDLREALQTAQRT